MPCDTLLRELTRQKSRENHPPPYRSPEDRIAPQSAPGQLQKMVEEKQTIGAIAGRFNVAIGDHLQLASKGGYRDAAGQAGRADPRAGGEIVKSETVQSHRGGPTTADLKNQPLSLHL